jgi:hypothetical protein
VGLAVGNGEGNGDGGRDGVSTGLAEIEGVPVGDLTGADVTFGVSMTSDLHNSHALGHILKMVV